MAARNMVTSHIVAQMERRNFVLTIVGPSFPSQGDSMYVRGYTDALTGRAIEWGDAIVLRVFPNAGKIWVTLHWHKFGYRGVYQYVLQ